eukprot:180621-Prorocentrum_minimum.AAC.2
MMPGAGGAHAQVRRLERVVLANFGAPALACGVGNPAPRPRLRFVLLRVRPLWPHPGAGRVCSDPPCLEILSPQGHPKRQAGKTRRGKDEDEGGEGCGSGLALGLFDRLWGGEEGSGPSMKVTFWECVVTLIA